MIEDVTEHALREASGVEYPSQRTLAQAASKSPKTLGKAHEAALAVFRRESCPTDAGAMWVLGPWSRVLVFGPKYLGKSQHKALIQLVAADRLRVLRVSGEDAKSLLPPGTPSSTVPPGTSFWFALAEPIASSGSGASGGGAARTRSRWRGR